MRQLTLSLLSQAEPSHSQQRNMKTVEIKKGKETILGTLHRGVLSLPNVLGKDLSEISFDGKTHGVLEIRLDERDDLLYLTLEVPKGSSGVKSNDESVKG